MPKTTAAGGRKYSLIESFWRLKLRLMRLVMFTTSIAVTLLVFVQVVSRYIFNYSFFGIEEAASYLAIILYFIGSAYGTFAKGHISAGLIDTFWKPGYFVDFSHIITRLISALLCAYLCWETWGLLQFNIQLDVRSVELRVPIAWVYTGMIIGMALMMFYFIVEMIEASINLFKQ